MITWHKKNSDPNVSTTLDANGQQQVSDLLHLLLILLKWLFVNFWRTVVRWEGNAAKANRPRRILKISLYVSLCVCYLKEAVG
jgi:hypothetical protein